MESKTADVKKLLEWLEEYPKDAKITVRRIEKEVKNLPVVNVPTEESIPVDFIIEWSCKEEAKREMIAMIKSWREKKK